MKKDKRDVLKGLAVGSVWSTPVVSSVILPTHAGTTSGDSAPSDSPPTYFSAAAPRTGLLFNDGERLSPIWICAVNNGDNVTVTFQGRSNNARRVAVIPMGGVGDTVLQATSPNCNQDSLVCGLTGTVDSISEQSIQLTFLTNNTLHLGTGNCIEGWGWTATVPAAECGSPPELNGPCVAQR